MKTAELQKSLRYLAELMDNMKALIEWQRLKQIEAYCNRGSSLRFYDSTGEQLFDKYNDFLFEASWLRKQLRRYKNQIPPKEFQSMTSQLNKLLAKLYYLGTEVRIY